MGKKQKEKNKIKEGIIRIILTGLILTFERFKA